MGKNVVIVEAARTPIGKFGGALKDFSAPQLGGLAIKEVIKRSGIPGEKVEWVLMGIADPNGVGEVPARQSSMLAGLPKETCAMTFSAACTSSLYAINTGYRLIRDGDAEVVIAGGMESMTNNPHLIYGARWGLGYRDATLVDGTKVCLTCPMGNVLMGVYGDIVSKEKGVTREQMDAWAVISQQRYEDARRAGKFADEIFAVSIPHKKGNPIMFSEDESPRPSTTIESLTQLKPAFSGDGLISAGNAPSINDGAGAIMLMTEQAALAHGLTPLAQILSYATVADEPKNIPIVPALTVRKALKRVGIKVEDVDLFELNEAFAAVSIIAMEMLKVGKDKVNVNGGAIATGHPVGFTGSRILMTLVYELRRRGGGVGVASLCGVGSQGEATVVRVY